MAKIANDLVMIFIPYYINRNSKVTSPFGQDIKQISVLKFDWLSLIFYLIVFVAVL